MRGSPPPMRGKACVPEAITAAPRITPAYAGKSPHVPKNVVTTVDHPRLCGEKRKRLASRQLDAGSPPPMRGKVSCQTCSSCHLRITPAYAGKSIDPLTSEEYHSDHPRLCGEKCLLAFRRTFSKGSPPPMRGKGGSCLRQGALSRITPAYAGKSQGQNAND